MYQLVYNNLVFGIYYHVYLPYQGWFISLYMAHITMYICHTKDGSYPCIWHILPCISAILRMVHILVLCHILPCISAIPRMVHILVYGTYYHVYLPYQGRFIFLYLAHITMYICHTKDDSYSCIWHILPCISAIPRMIHILVFG